MDSMIKFNPEGSVTSAGGYVAGATFAGLKTPGREVLDLGILFSELPAKVAGTYSTNKILSPSVTVTKDKTKNYKARGVVANSGCANCSVGPQGTADALEVSSLASKHVGIDENDMLVCSTGMIGVELPMALIRQGIGDINLTSDGGHAFARAIMTTDSNPKHASVSFDLDGESYTIGGVAKGVGMIHPNMATMLCFLTTDANISSEFLQTSLTEAVDETFNMIDVDGDQSTNDTVLLFSNSAAGGPQITKSSPNAGMFQEALTLITTHLAKELVKDGEGAERIFAVTVAGASSTSDARVSAREIASSNLVKAMVHGKDPNWGRLMMALGKSDIEIEESMVDIFINDIHIVHEGVAIPYYADAVIAGMNVPEVRFRIELNKGTQEATAWSCDLTEEYVTFNSAYST